MERERDEKSQNNNDIGRRKEGGQFSDTRKQLKVSQISHHKWFVRYKVCIGSPPDGCVLCIQLCILLSTYDYYYVSYGETSSGYPSFMVSMARNRVVLSLSLFNIHLYFWLQTIVGHLECRNKCLLIVYLYAHTGTCTSIFGVFSGDISRRWGYFSDG